MSEQLAPMIMQSGFRNGQDIRDLTLGATLTERARHHGSKVFLSYLPDRRVFTFEEVHLSTNRLANGLLQAGIRPGSHVAVFMENCPEQLFSFFALAKIGAVAVPINAAARGSLLAYFIKQSDVMSVIVEDSLIDRVTDVLPNIPNVRLIVTTGERRSGEGQKTDLVAYDQLLGASEAHPDVKVRFSDLAMIGYTSGTTGPSKGCMFSHARTLLWGMSHAEAFGHRASDIFYVCLPLFHVNALQGSVYNALMLNAQVVLQRRFSASGFWADIRDSKATIANMLGSMVNILWSLPPSPLDSDNALRLSQVTPVPPFATAFEERFGLSFVGGYGLTDYCASHAYPADDRKDKLGSCGRTRRGVEARVVDENDFDVPYGEVGELLIRNNNMWEAGEGYYKMPEASLTGMRNGWFHTGDRGYIDEDGYLWFVGRQKDVIRRRGENISAFEVEQIVLTHPDIMDAAAYPVSSNLGEEDVALSVVLMPSSALKEAELIEFCVENMSYFMVPKYIRFVTDLPRNLSQKVEKYRLREEAESDLGRFWDREKSGIVIKR